MNATQENSIKAGAAQGDFSKTPGTRLEAFRAYMEATNNYEDAAKTYHMVSSSVRTFYAGLRDDGVKAADLPGELLEIVEHAVLMRSKAWTARERAAEKAQDCQKAWSVLAE